MSDSSTVEELNIKVKGDETSLDASFAGNLKSLDDFVRGVDQRSQKIATILKKTNEKLGKGFDFGLSPGNRGGAGSPAATVEIDKQISAMRRLSAERRAMLITDEQYKTKLKEIADTAVQGSNAQLAALGRLRGMEQEEAKEAKRIADQKERDAKRVTSALEAEARKQDAARRRGSPISQAVLTSRFNAPGGEMQPLVGRTAAAFGLGGDAAAVAGLAAGAAAAMGMAAFEQAKKAIALAADFEQAMDVLGQQSGATTGELEQFRKKAEELGADLTLPATSSLDAAQAMLELSKAGLSVEDSMNGAHGALTLAAAAQTSAGEAANMVASQLKAFNLAGTEAGRVADLLAATANNSLGDIGDMAQAAQQASSAFAQAKIPIQDMYTAIGLLANAGIKGSDAGTSLRVMLTRLQAPTDDAKKLMDGLGLKVYDNQGKFVGLRDVIGQFESKLKDATDQQKKQIAQIIFGEDAQRAFNVVLAGGVKQYDDMGKKVGELGAAQKTAAAYTQGFKGAVDGLGSAWSSFLTKQGAPALSWLTAGIKLTTTWIGKLDAWMDALNSAKDAQENGLNVASMRSESQRAKAQATALGQIQTGQVAPSKQQIAIQKGLDVVGMLPLPGGLQGMAMGAKAWVSNPMVNRQRALAEANLPWNASNKEIEAKKQELLGLSRQYENTLLKKSKQRKPVAVTPKPTDSGTGDAWLQALLDSVNGGKKKHSGGGGIGSVPSYVDVPDTVSMPERSGKRTYEDRLQGLDDAFAATRAQAAESGTALNEYAMTVERLQKRLSIAGDVIAETKKKIAELTPTVKAQESAFIGAAAAYKAVAEPLSAKMRRGYKPTEAEKRALAPLREAYERTGKAFNPNKQLFDSLQATNRAAGRQQSDDTVSLASEQTRYITTQREAFLKKLKEKVAGGGSVADYEAEIKAAMQRILDKGGKDAINGDDYQGYREALTASESGRGDLDRSIRQATKGESKADRIAALDAEIAEKRAKGAEEIGLQAYHDDQLRKIDQKFYADQQKDATEQFKWQMEAGEKSRAQYREFLESSLPETRKRFGDTSKEVAALNMEILRLDWQGIDDDSRSFKESLDEGTLGIRDYIAALQGLQSRVSDTSQPFKALQRDIDEANRKILEGKRKTADDIGDRAGSAAVDILHGRSSLKSVIKDSVSGAMDDALKDSVKRWASKLAMNFLGQKDSADKAKEAADLTNLASNKMLQAAETFAGAANQPFSGGNGPLAPGSGGGSGVGGAIGAALGGSSSGGPLAGLTNFTKTITGAGKTITQVFGKTAGSDIGKLAAGAGKWLGYAGAAYGVFEMVKGLQAAKERGFETREGSKRFANLGSGDHTGYFDTSAYSGPDGMRRLNQRGEDRQSQGGSHSNVTNIHPGAIVIQGAGRDAAEIADEVITRLSQQSAMDNAMSGVTG